MTTAVSPGLGVGSGWAAGTRAGSPGKASTLRPRSAATAAAMAANGGSVTRQGRPGARCSRLAHGRSAEDRAARSAAWWRRPPAPGRAPRGSPPAGPEPGPPPAARPGTASRRRRRRGRAGLPQTTLKRRRPPREPWSLARRPLWTPSPAMSDPSSAAAPHKAQSGSAPSTCPWAWSGTPSSRRTTPSCWPGCRASPGRSVTCPADIAEAVAFLASARAAYITGEVLNVAAGAYMRN